MRVEPTHWRPPSCERLLCGCCDCVVYESNPLLIIAVRQNQIYVGAIIHHPDSSTRK
jgi:hypothetical protein